MELSDGPGLLCGRFELLREEPATTGVQLFGPTLAVLDTHSGEPARACVLDAALLPTPDARGAFVRALAELADLQDPALVPQVFVGQDGERVVVCYDPLQGAFALRDMDDGPGSADLAHELQRLGRQLARALASLHARGRVHGMLAGEAVFVGPRGPAAFQHGFAPLCARDELERRWRALDPAVLAPELLAGGPFTPAADSYAWGVALAEFATGQRGAAALGAPEPAGLPAGLWSLIHGCLASDPGARPRDGADLLRRIESLALGGGAEATGPDAPVPETLSEAPASLPVPADSPPPERAAPAASVPPAPPLTSLEELLIAGDRAKRPPTVPPGLVSAAALSAVPGPGAAAVVTLSAAPDPSPPPSGSEVSSRLPLSESSGEGRVPGRSGTGLRRVHVLTEDAIVRPGRSSGARSLEAPAEASGATLEAPTVEPGSTSAPELAPSAPEPPRVADRGSADATPVRPPEAAAPKKSDPTFWLLIVALLVALALAWAFT